MYAEVQGVNSNYNGVRPGVSANNVFTGNIGLLHNTSTASAHLANYGSVDDPAWYIDSGATNHVTQNAGILFQYSVYHGTEKLHIRNDLGPPIHNMGSAVVQILSAALIYLHNVLHVPTIIKNLLSVSKLLADNNVLIEFFDNVYFVKAKNTRTILLKGIARGGLYQVEYLNVVCRDSRFHIPVSSLSNF